MQEGGVLNIRIKPEIPQHLFVGAMDGPASCTPDDNLYEIWPKFLIMVLLQGQQHFVMDGEHFRIDAGSEHNPEPVVFMLNVARGCKLQFVNESATPLRKVMISAPLPWIDRLIRSQPTSMPNLRAFFLGILRPSALRRTGISRRSPNISSNRPAPWRVSF